MRRQLRAALPGLAHWFGIKPWELQDLTYGEIEVFTTALRKCPPIGGAIQYQAR